MPPLSIKYGLLTGLLKDNDWLYNPLIIAKEGTCIGPAIHSHDILLIVEIRRSPVEVGSLSHYLRRVLYISGGDRRISEPSTVHSLKLT